MKLPYFAFALSLAAFSVSAQAQTVASFNFETDQSASFAVFKGVGDATANFNYDHSSYSPTSPTVRPASIPSAPNGTGTKALRLEANNGDATSAADAVTVFATAAAGLSNYVMTFDAFINYPGEAGGSGAGVTGSTEMLFWGGNSQGTSAEWQSSTATNAWFVGMTGEGGSSIDYRFYHGNGGAATTSHATPNWNGADEKDNALPGWSGLFPVSANGYETAGSPGKAWVTVETVVNGSNVTIFMTPTGGVKTQVSSFVSPNSPTSGYPFISYSDIFGGSLANPAADSFALIDNLVIAVPEVPTSVDDWALYQ